MIARGSAASASAIVSREERAPDERGGFLPYRVDTTIGATNYAAIPARCSRAPGAGSASTTTAAQTAGVRALS